MAAKIMIARYLGLTMSQERALADAFVLTALRHATEPEVRYAARLYSNWCHRHISALRPAVDRYGAARSADGERLRRALFHGRRVGGFGLMRDFHDLMTLATSVHVCWSALTQAARERRDEALENACSASDAETLRQISWLETKLRQSAPQALTVPSLTGRELLASIPAGDHIRAIIDLVPGPALRGVMPLASAAAAVLVVFGIVRAVTLSYAHRAQ
jgi:hypothetical protein